jgi:hypothetical protein
MHKICAKIKKFASGCTFLNLFTVNFDDLVKAIIFLTARYLSSACDGIGQFSAQKQLNCGW